MTHFAFVNKSQNQYDYKWNLTLIDKRKMCHFECHGLIWKTIKFLKTFFNETFSSGFKCEFIQKISKLIND
jgi:hypothetical protein